MAEIFQSLASLITIDPISIDNNVFRLHYKATTLFLIIFSIMVASKQQFGDPIDCLVDNTKSSDFNDAVDTYCWVHSTYTVNDLPNDPRKILHPGVGQLLDKTQTTKYQNYYQWIAFVLLFQALAFYMPRFLWKVWEGGRMKMLCQDIDVVTIDEDSKATRKKLILHYFSGHFGNQSLYFLGFVTCEILNFTNVILQIILTDVLLGYEFSTYGTEVLAFPRHDPFDRIDPMDRIFPKLTKCEVRIYGPGGGIIPYDAICVLPLNKVNEMGYIFLWFWFIILACISSLGLTYRLATILLPDLRRCILKFKTSSMDSQQLKFICEECLISDWFVLYQLGKNIDSIIFTEFLKDLGRAIQTQKLTYKNA